jgi:acetyltransferase
MQDQPLERPLFKSPSPVLAPRSVAIVGASERAKWPKQIFAQLREFGFPGEVFPVNPRLTEIWGVRCYPDLASLPRPAAHAAVIVPATAVQSVLETGATTGLKSATIYASNLGEGDDPGIVARGTALKALIARTGLAVSGPNCMGANSQREQYFGYPAAELCSAPAGAVALISQSGGTVRYIAQQGRDRGIKFGYAISSGNELDLDMADYVNHFVDDPQTRCIALFIEGIRRPAAFMAAAGRALQSGKPIVAIKTGRSRKSRDASRSHTGAIAGDYEAFVAVCERYGIVLCASLDEMIEVLLAMQPGRFPKGHRVGFVTTSGGTVDLLHDELATAAGIETPAYGPDTKARIRKMVAPEVAIENPIDAGDPSTDAVAADMCKAVLADPSVDMLAWANVLPWRAGARDVAAVRSVVEASEKPVIAFGRMSYMVSKDGLEFQDQVGFPFMQGLPATLRSLSALGFYGARVGRSIGPLPPPRAQVSALSDDALHAALATHEVSAPRSEIALMPEAAAAAAERIGFPVALKIVSPDISHKTEVGGVVLGLDSAAKVTAGAVALADAARKAAPAAQLRGFLGQEMISGTELIIGARRDPHYGPIIVVGAGGILVELTNDIATRLLPIDRNDAEAMIDALKVSRLLAGYRGRPACDRDALISAICGFAQVYLDHRHLVAEMEINPLMVLRKGEGVRAADVRWVPLRDENEPKSQMMRP